MLGHKEAQNSPRCFKGTFNCWFSRLHQHLCFFSWTNSIPNRNELRVLSSFDNCCRLRVSFEEIRLLYRIWSCSNVTILKYLFATDHERLTSLVLSIFEVLLFCCYCNFLTQFHLIRLAYKELFHTLSNPFCHLQVGVYLVCPFSLLNVENASNPLYGNFTTTFFYLDFFCRYYD